MTELFPQYIPSFLANTHSIGGGTLNCLTKNSLVKKTQRFNAKCTVNNFVVPVVSGSFSAIQPKLSCQYT